MTAPRDTPLFIGTLPAQPDTYLGNPDVVEQLVREFVHDIAVADDIEAVTAVVNKTARIFCGMDAAYQPVPGWNERLQLGIAISARIGVDVNQDWESIMRTGLLKAVIEIRRIIRTLGDGPEEHWQWQVDALIEFWTSLLVGTVDITHPLEDE